MNKSFHPFFRGQNRQRDKIAQQAQEIRDLKTQLEQYGKDAIDQAKRVDRALQERDEAIHLYNTLEAERDNLKARNADLEDEIARLKHKKLPSKADNVVAQS